MGPWALFGGYTQSHLTSPELFSAFELIRTSKRFKGKKLMFFMDENAHHRDWLGSKKTDQARIVARAFAGDYGMQQYVHFPARGENILDLVISDLSVDTACNPLYPPANCPLPRSTHHHCASCDHNEPLPYDHLAASLHRQHRPASESP